MSAMPTPRESGEKFIILFDFDDTITRGDSDELISRYVGKGHLFDAAILLYNTPQLQWTNFMSSIVSTSTREELAVAIGASLQIPQPTIDALRMLHELSTGPNPTVEYGIVSDANDLFIDEAFKQIIKVPTPPLYTNHFVDLRETPEGPGVCPETGKPTYSKLTWFLPESHTCERCKVCPNMCKSLATERVLANTKLTDPTIIFCGDGFNDSCPMQKVLRLRDHMFARRGFRLERILMDPAEKKGVCHHHFWYSGEDLHALLKRTVGPDAKRLPPVVLMGNEGGSPLEFRTRYITSMMQGIIGRIISEYEEKDNKGARYAPLISALKQLCDDVSGANPNVLKDPAGLAQRQEFLPIPQCFLAYGGSWQDMPWVQGCNYLYMLLWAIVYRLGAPSETPSVALDGAPCAFHVDAFTGYAFPKASLVAIKDIAAHREPSFDCFQSEKTSVTETFFASHIRPMVAQVDAFLAKAAPDCLSTSAGSAEVLAELRRLLSACVWGNTVDLSMFNREQLVTMSQQSDSPHAGHAADHTVLDAKVVANDMDAAAAYLLARLQHYGGANAPSSGPAAVDIVMDNMGVECAADMLLGAVLTALAPVKVRYHTKPIPFCVSDVMPKDIQMMLTKWEADSETHSLAARFRKGMADGHIEVHTHPYWVHPSEYREMPPPLVNAYFFSKRFGGENTTGTVVGSHDLKNFGTVHEYIVPHSDLVIFKGDVNYRRVCGDRHWTPEMFFSKSRPKDAPRNDGHVPFTRVLQDYWPYTAVPVLALRTNKSEVTVGPSDEQIDALDAATGGTWRCNGQYAVAVFACM